MHKYQIGDIITTGHYHYLIEDIDLNGYESMCYVMRRLEIDGTISAYVLPVDRDEDIKRVA